jgi:citrate synthase
MKVVEMFADMKEKVSDWTDEEEVGTYLRALLHKEAFDKAGLIYGMGHAIYSVSDPRAEILKSCAHRLAVENGFEEQLELYEYVAETAPELIAEKRKMYKGVSANVDFYSGLIYQMLRLPEELFTPIFAMSRISGWSAHRIEEIQNEGKIIRPAYISVKDEVPYVPINER